MHKKRSLLFLVVMATILFSTMSFTVFAASVARISTDELKSRLGEKELLVIDVRSQGDWAGSGVKIATAERVEPGNFDQWADAHSKEDTVVLYCA